MLRSQDYHRLHIACLAMAKQSTLPDVQARWLAMANEWLKLAAEEGSRSRRGTHNTGTAAQHFNFIGERRR